MSAVPAFVPNRAQNGWIHARGHNEFMCRPEEDNGVMLDAFVLDAMHLNHVADQIRGSVCIDVGANIGTITLRMLELGARHVVAVEPERENLDLLFRNVGRDDRVRIEPFAVGDPRVAQVVETVGTGGPAYTEATGPTGVAVVSFGEVLGWALAQCAAADPDEPDRPLENVAFVSVDVEGGEFGWFDTASDDDMKRVDRFAIEWHGQATAPHIGPDDGRYGRMMTKLGRTHSVSTFGVPDDGGYLFAHGYWI